MRSRQTRAHYFLLIAPDELTASSIGETAAAGAHWRLSANRDASGKRQRLVLFQRLAGLGIDLDHLDPIAPQMRDVLQGAVALVFVEQDAVAQAMLERQPPPAGQVGVDDLNIG